MKKIALVSALLLSMGTAQAAETLRWDSMSVSYDSVDLDGEKVSGFSLSGTKLVAENVFLGSISDDIGVANMKIDVEMDSFSIGAGYRHALAENTDVFGIFSFEDVNSKASLGDISERDNGNGYGLETGIRSLVTEQLELMGSISYIAIKDDSETSFNASALYHFTDQFSAGLGYSTADDVDVVSLSAVWFF